MHERTPVNLRHLARGLRHRLIGTPEEVAQYEKEVAAHLRDDASDHIAAAQAEAKRAPAAPAETKAPKHDPLEGPWLIRHQK